MNLKLSPRIDIRTLRNPLYYLIGPLATKCVGVKLNVRENTHTKLLMPYKRGHVKFLAPLPGIG